MAQDGTPYLIPFGAAGMVAHPNRWQAQPGELFLAENVVLENDLLQKEPSATYYDDDGAGNHGAAVLGYGFSFLASETWLATATFFAADPTTPIPPVNTTQTIDIGSTNPGTSWQITLHDPCPAGTVHAVRFSREAGTGGASAIVDERGNIYTKVHEATGGGMLSQLWVSVVTTGLQSGDHMTLTLDDGTADVNVVASVLEGMRLPLRIVAQGSNTGTSTHADTSIMQSHTYPVVAVVSLITTDLHTFDPLADLSVDNRELLVDVGQTLLGNHELHAFQQAPFVANQQLIAQTEWNSDATNTPAGTVTVTKGSTLVTGSGTNFVTAYRAGDTLFVLGEPRIVDRVDDATHLHTVDAWENTVSV